MTEIFIHPDCIPQDVNECQLCIKRCRGSVLLICLGSLQRLSFVQGTLPRPGWDRFKMYREKKPKKREDIVMTGTATTFLHLRWTWSSPTVIWCVFWESSPRRPVDSFTQTRLHLSGSNEENRCREYERCHDQTTNKPYKGLFEGCFYTGTLFSVLIKLE